MSSLANFFQIRNKGLKHDTGIKTNEAIVSIFSSKKKPALPQPVKSKSKKIKKEELIQPVQPAAVPAQVEISQPKNTQPENLDATIFVGNVPLTSTHASIKKIFGQYGKILKVWFRSIPVEQSKLPRKASHILKQYQEGADSMNAYVKFENESQARAALAANGLLVEGKNIKVTMCSEIEIDYETTIFIGNLPLKVKDQDLWDAFGPIGSIRSVRVIRKRGSLQGIGIAYVRFETKQAMRKAIQEMNGKSIGDRPMRIKKAVSKERIEKKFRKIKEKKEKKTFSSRHQNVQEQEVQNEESPKNEQVRKTKFISKQTKPASKFQNNNKNGNKHNRQ